MSDTESDIETKSDDNFTMNAKGYIQFNENLIIANRYQLKSEIVVDEQLGTIAKGRYGSVFVVRDLHFKNEIVLKALKINRIPPEAEDAKRQAVKRRLKQQQKKRLNMILAKNNANSDTSLNNNINNNTNNNKNGGKREKTVRERYISSCKREIGVLKRISRENKDEKYPVLILYDNGEYLCHTYMIFPIYDQTLQQHLIYSQRECESIKASSTSSTVNCLISPIDLWAFEEQLLSAIAYIHRVCFVMHLDFKPKNIMINKYGYECIECEMNADLHFIKLNDNSITLIDFSVSAKAPKKTDLNVVRFTGNFGTRRYRPPEMIYGGKWNRSVDTYGTAMIVLECIRLQPIIDTTYYKKKKLMKYKHKYQHKIEKYSTPEYYDKKKLLQMKKIIQGKKQLEIWEVLYLIIQQIGFPADLYWNTRVPLDVKLLFPTKKKWCNLNHALKCRLFYKKNYKNNNSNRKRCKKRKKKKRRKKRRMNDDNSPSSSTDSSSNSSQSSSSVISTSGSSTDSDFNDLNINGNDENYISDMRTFKLRFSSQSKCVIGQAWALFESFGEECIAKYQLNRMLESLQRMVEWDPTTRITPEDALQEYFNKIPSYLMAEEDDEEDNDETYANKFRAMNQELRAEHKKKRKKSGSNGS